MLLTSMSNRDLKLDPETREERIKRLEKEVKKLSEDVRNYADKKWVPWNRKLGEKCSKNPSSDSDCEKYFNVDRLYDAKFERMMEAIDKLNLEERLLEAEKSFSEDLEKIKKTLNPIKDTIEKTGKQLKRAGKAIWDAASKPKVSSRDQAPSIPIA